ncbi:MAG: hypothetical protein ACLFRD_11305 [Nitriliruptoraceae bacterium]
MSGAGTSQGHGTRIEVVRGGELSDAEVAALTVALTSSGAAAPHAGTPAWRVAGLLEAGGGPPVTDAADLAHRRRRH